MKALLAVALVTAVGCSPAGQSVTPPPSSLNSPTTSTAPVTTNPATQPPIAAVDAIFEFRSSVARLPSDAATQADLNAVVLADTNFAFRLYHELVAGDEEELFFSPYSISTALSMAFAGARGETAAQMANVLGVGDDPNAWHAARNRLELSLADVSGVQPYQGEALPLTLEPTNAIFGQSGYPFKDEFLDTLAANYGAGLQALDISSDPEAARLAINQWVADRTRDRIIELLKQGVIDDMTRAVLVNAIFFKGNWFRQFDPKETRPEPFHMLDGSVHDVETMHLADPKMDYASGDGWEALRLPYWGGASMLVILPKEGKFSAIERQVDADFLGALGADLSERQTTLSMPRWESESAVDLKGTLSDLGIVDLFDANRADLTGIADVEQLYVSHVAHQANITVDETGTEAAAATAVTVEAVSGAAPVTLTIDRPFIYLIRDDVTGEILFMGRVLNP
jgi:serpin B